MFTVVICDKKIRDDCKDKYSIYLKPLLDSRDFVFCEWNTEGNSLAEAVPELSAAIERRREWNAILVLSRDVIGYEATCRRNPFDFAGAVKKPEQLESVEQIEAFRAAKTAAVRRALENPLTKLAIWLSGIPLRTCPELPAAYAELPPLSEPEAYFEALSERDLDAVRIELDRARLARYEAVAGNFERDGEVFCLPKHLFAVAERSSDGALNRDSDLWKEHYELNYSRFFEDNLYPDKLRYLLYDIPYLRRERNEFSYFNFLTVLLLLATKEPPYEAIRANRVYRLEAEIDSSLITGVFGRYVRKLTATHEMISHRIARIKVKEPETVSNYDAQRIFESGVDIPVEIDSSFDTGQLMAKYDALGLSADCPSDELAYWDGQYREIGKLLVRYLREPKRAVKNAVKERFRKENRIEDERALFLNENQREDVLFKLQEEEQRMVESTVRDAFDVQAYREQMEEADREIRRGIAHRMTRKKTVAAGAAVLGAYLVGFLPLLIHAGGAGRFSFGLLVTLCSVAVLAGVGAVSLFVLRHRLVNRFRHFNYVMSGILSGIEDSLHRCSVYLSHACNVMREFSVLNCIVRVDDTDTRNCKIMKNHLHDIEEKLDEVTTLFAEYAPAVGETSGETPYNYDFTALRNYEYPMPYVATSNTVEYIQRGNEIEIPIDYLRSVTVEREELYD